MVVSVGRGAGRPLRVFVATALAIALLPAVATPSQAQGGGEIPPASPPPSATFGSDSVRLPVHDLSLPPGSGVPAAGTDRSVSAPVTAAPVTPTGTAGAASAGALTFVAADPAPPPRLPAGASFGTSGLSFGESDLVAGQVSDLAFGESSANLGGMTVQAEGGGLRFTLGADVLFDFDKANLRREADPILRGLVEQVRAEMPRARYSVEGHTDAKGSDAYNMGLSNRRARSVRDWLVKQGAATAGAVATVGFGENIPVAPNEQPDGSDDPEGRQKNRRVEIVVTPLS